jgi:gliding motility-associated-like protein
MKPLETTTYCATVTNANGCKSEACVEILVRAESTLYIPNVFTPNGDGINDEFRIAGYNLSEFDMKLFNRWGQLLFQTNDPLKGWDGSFGGKTVAGVYVFILKAKGNDGSEYRKSGHVTLIQ